MDRIEKRLFNIHSRIGGKTVIDAQIMPKTNSKWWQPPPWIDFPWLSWTCIRLSTIDLNHDTKLHANRSQSNRTCRSSWYKCYINWHILGSA